jgi:predicted regulator of Ras-like GTPase activity (Roadblock/LC7/MglB family)
MKSPFGARLEALGRIRGVSGAMVVGESDGLVIDAILQEGTRGDVVAALAASLYRRARLAVGAAGLGSSGFLQLDAEEGRICAAGIGDGDLVLVALAETRANIGLIRMEMLRDPGEQS